VPSRANDSYVVVVVPNHDVLLILPAEFSLLGIEYASLRRTVRFTSYATKDRLRR